MKVVRRARLGMPSLSLCSNFSVWSCSHNHHGDHVQVVARVVMHAPLVQLTESLEKLHKDNGNSLFPFSFPIRCPSTSQQVSVVFLLNWVFISFVVVHTPGVAYSWQGAPGWRCAGGACLCTCTLRREDGSTCMRSHGCPGIHNSSKQEAGMGVSDAQQLSLLSRQHLWGCLQSPRPAPQ